MAQRWVSTARQQTTTSGNAVKINRSGHRLVDSYRRQVVPDDGGSTSSDGGKPTKSVNWWLDEIERARKTDNCSGVFENKPTVRL